MSEAPASPARDRRLLAALRAMLTAPPATVRECLGDAAREATGATASAVFLASEGRLARVAGNDAADLETLAMETVATGVPACRPREGRTVAAVPLSIDGTVAGALAVELRGTEADLEVLEVLGAGVALAIARDRDRSGVRDRVGSALGRLAIHIVHELNNPLGGLKLYTSLLERSIAKGEVERSLDLVRKVARGIDDLTTLVADIRTYDRARGTGALHQVIESCLDECLARGKTSGGEGAGGT